MENIAERLVNFYLVHVKPFSSLYKFYCFKVSKLKTILTVNHTNDAIFPGLYFPRMRNAVYFVVGSWCLGALVLGCAYNSLLISYILGSNSEPLVDSLAKLVKNPNVQLVVEKGRGIELALLVLKNKN
jgi:hypothetical protein